MISPTADAGRTPTQRTTPPIETFLRVIVVSFVALTLFAIPREGAVQPPLATRVIAGSGVGGQSKVRVFDGTTAAPLPPPLGSFTALTQNPGGEVRVAGCDFNDGTDDIIASPGLGNVRRCVFSTVSRGYPSRHPWAPSLPLRVASSMESISPAAI